MQHTSDWIATPKETASHESGIRNLDRIAYLGEFAGANELLAKYRALLDEAREQRLVTLENNLDTWTANTVIQMEVGVLEDVVLRLEGAASFASRRLADYLERQHEKWSAKVEQAMDELGPDADEDAIAQRAKELCQP